MPPKRRETDEQQAERVAATEKRKAESNDRRRIDNPFVTKQEAQLWHLRNAQR